MRRALRLRIAVVVFAPAVCRGPWAASATMGDAAFECPERAAREGQCFLQLLSMEVMTQTFGQLGSGSGLTRRVGRGASTQAFLHRLPGWLAVVKWCGVAVCEALSTLSPAVQLICTCIQHFRYDVSNRSLPTTLPVHCFACDTPWEPRLPPAAVSSPQTKQGEARELLV